MPVVKNPSIIDNIRRYYDTLSWLDDKAKATEALLLEEKIQQQNKVDQQASTEQLQVTAKKTESDSTQSISPEKERSQSKEGTVK